MQTKPPLEPTPDSSSRARLLEWEAHLQAFASISDPSDLPPGHGTLAGVTLGVKDIIDVAGLPTGNGSETCRDAAQARVDAPVVAALRQAGVQITGKTVTTEFAFTDPTDCRNPHDLTRSPGGSSSGSGAAVGAGILDVALGTQTAGSLCRPAAYCGAVGFKPSFGALSTRGVTPLAPSFDTVGIIARSVDLAQRSFFAICPNSANPGTTETSPLRVRKALFSTSVTAVPALQTALEQAAGKLSDARCLVESTSFDVDAESIVANHRIVMNYEATAAHRSLIAQPYLGMLRPNFRAGLLSGAEISVAMMGQAAQTLTAARTNFWHHLSEVDIVLTLAVPDVAPPMGGTTGFQEWLTPWTVFGGPLISLPWGLDPDGHPLSVMLAAHPGKDADLLAFAGRLESLAPALPRPKLPVSRVTS